MKNVTLAQACSVTAPPQRPCAPVDRCGNRTWAQKNYRIILPYVCSACPAGASTRLHEKGRCGTLTFGLGVVSRHLHCRQGFHGLPRSHQLFLVHVHTSSVHCTDSTKVRRRCRPPAQYTSCTAHTAAPCSPEVYGIYHPG